MTEWPFSGHQQGHADQKETLGGSHQKLLKGQHSETGANVENSAESEVNECTVWKMTHFFFDVQTQMFCVCRQKLTQDYSHQVLSVLQQWETDVQKSEEQEEKLNVSGGCRKM